MSLRQKLGWLLLLLLIAELPAFANNPPQPDGLFSILLILPMAILAGRLAEVAPIRRTTGARISWGIVLAAAVLLLMVGTELGALAALAVTVYAIVRAVKVIRRGQGAKRLVAAGVLVLFAVFAFADYFTSIAELPPSMALFEATAVGKLRQLSTAEVQFAGSGSVGSPSAPEYGTLENLDAAHLIESGIAQGRAISGYQYGQFLAPDRKRFFIYAIPAQGLKPSSDLEFVPGASLFHAFFPRARAGTGTRSFAVDESGTLHYAIRSNASPVTQEEVAGWPPIE
jgi:hypothetical protein